MTISQTRSHFSFELVNRELAFNHMIHTWEEPFLYEQLLYMFITLLRCMNMGNG